MNKEILEYAQKLIKKKEKDIDLRDPMMIVYKVTDRCNLKCKYCYQGQAHSENSISVDKVLEFIDFIATQKRGYIYIAFHGGEPMLEETKIACLVESLLKRKYAKRIRFSLQTNGTVFSSKIFDLCKEKHITIGLSIDGFDEYTNLCRLEDTNINEYFKRVHKTIKYLNDNEIDFSVISVLSRFNHMHIERIIDFLIQHKVRTWSCNDLVYNDNINDSSILLTAEEKLDAYKRIIDCILDHNKKVNPYNRFYETNIRQWLSSISGNNSFIYDICGSNPCGLFTHTISLESDGTVFPCDMVTSKEYKVLNIHSLSEEEYYEFVPKKEKMDIECVQKCSEQCESRVICKMNCKAIGMSGVTKSEFCKFYKPLYDYLLLISNVKNNLELLNPTINKRNL